ncbi:MAG: ATP-binding protein [Methylocystis sp.]
MRERGSERMNDDLHWRAKRLRLFSRLSEALFSANVRQSSLFLASFFVLTAGVFSCSQVFAQSAAFAAEAGYDPGVANFAFSSGLALITAVVALTYITERRSWRNSAKRFSRELADTRSRLEQAQKLLSSEAQILIAWTGVDSTPDVHISTIKSLEGHSPQSLLSFHSWLSSEPAQALESALARLRLNGEGFSLSLTSCAGVHFDIQGRAIGSCAVMRIREISGDRLELLSMRTRYQEMENELSSLCALLDASSVPVWLRNQEGKIIFANGAYAAAVEAKDQVDVLTRGLELLDQPARDLAVASLQRELIWQARVPAIVAGQRHSLDVTQVASRDMVAAMAIDRHEVEIVRADLQRQMLSHVKTLDLLPTAVAIFGQDKRLIYYNDAYAKLWLIDAAILEQKPSDGELLDWLRAKQRLPVESDYRSWKERMFGVYRSTEAARYTWHLPDGRIIDVVAHPNTQGGVTYLYDDTTKAYDLETRFNALNRMQSETLETLCEGVVVFGSDGRLSFCNPAFVALWRLPTEFQQEKPHIDRVIEMCQSQHGEESGWAALKHFVTGLNELRQGFTQRIERNDNMILDCTAQSLLDGAALLTFVDVTANVNAERALSERNKALLAAENLRNDFIHHVSYELRSPLNNINGFIHLLNEQATGSLNAKQIEYLGYVSKSSAALLAIVDDILDLATIDKDAMDLELSNIDVEQAMRSAIEGVQDRLAENSIDVQIVAMDNVGCFKADAKRLRQILFNLLSNAIGFSSPGQAVTLAAFRRNGEVIFKVTDCGRGISPDVLDKIFDRFESYTSGSRHRGVGLGLSIVRAFMELHGGKVFVDSAPGEGTTVTCVFPASLALDQTAQIVNQRGA